MIPKEKLIDPAREDGPRLDEPNKNEIRVVERNLGDRCCNTLNFKSSGSLAKGGQKHTLGYYVYHSKGEDGTHVYYKKDKYQSQRGLYLYISKTWAHHGVYEGSWYISGTKGTSGGYAWITDGDQCPEKLERKWKWYDWNKNYMVLDKTATMICETPRPPRPLNCCKKILFESKGNIKKSGQAHVIGSYDYFSEGNDGTHVYKQLNGQFHDNYLYFMPSFGLWFIGQNAGKSIGYAMNKKEGPECPERLEKTWKWWNYEVGAWNFDNLAVIRCRHGE